MYVEVSNFKQDGLPSMEGSSSEDTQAPDARYNTTQSDNPRTVSLTICIQRTNQRAETMLKADEISSKGKSCGKS